MDEIKKIITIQVNESGKTVRKAKEEADAAAGSYKALAREMSKLKKEWKETADEAERAQLGEKIKGINDQLKTMDASIGNFQRNVGNYSGAIEDSAKVILGRFGNIGNEIKALIPLTKKATTAATVGLSGVKKAIASTGIGLLVIALGEVVAHWQDITKWVKDFIGYETQAEKITRQHAEAMAELKRNADGLSALKFDNDVDVILGNMTQTEALEEQMKAQKKIMDKAKAERDRTEAQWRNEKKKKNKEAAKEAYDSAKSEYEAQRDAYNNIYQEWVKSTARDTKAKQDATKKEQEDAAKAAADAAKARREEYLKAVKALEDYLKTEEELLLDWYNEQYAIVKNNEQAVANLKAQYDKRLAEIQKKKNDDDLKAKQDAALQEAHIVEQGLENIRNTYIQGTQAWIDADIELKEQQLENIKELGAKLGELDVDYQARLIAAKNALNEAKAAKATKNPDGSDIQDAPDAEKTVLDHTLKNYQEYYAILDKMRQEDSINEYEALQAKIEYWLNYSDSLGSILDSTASIWEQSIQRRLKAEKISQEEAEKEFENVKALQIATTWVSTLGACAQIFADPTIPTYWVKAAMAAAQLAAGVASTVQIANTKIGGGTSGAGSGGGTTAFVTPQMTDFNPEYMTNVTGRNEVTQLANALTDQPMRAYVVESDITSAQTKSKQRTEEATF